MQLTETLLDFIPDAIYDRPLVVNKFSHVCDDVYLVTFKTADGDGSSKAIEALRICGFSVYGMDHEMRPDIVKVQVSVYMTGIPSRIVRYRLLRKEGA